MQKITKLLTGGFDFHIHAAPDGFRPRSLDFQTAATQAQLEGMGGIVIKNHEYCTASITQLITESDISVFGGVVLNHAVGGLNPDAIDACARLGGRFVWMPTFSAASDRSETKVKKEIRLFSTNGTPMEILEELLETVRDSKMILATGHLEFREILLLMEIAKRIGLSKIIINHPFRLEGPNLRVEEQQRLASAGAVLEQCAFHFLKPDSPLTVKTCADAIRQIGINHCIIASDLGQVGHPFPAEGLKWFVSRLIEAGISPTEIRIMIRENPLRLLD